MMRNRRRFTMLALGFLGLAPVASAQLAYDRTTLLNGFASDNTIWTHVYRDLSLMTPPNYLSTYIGLRTVQNPLVDPRLRYDDQKAAVSTIFTAGTQHVLVGHSLGSLVARGVYLDYPGLRPNISGIIATVAPHQGTPMAANADKLSAFMADVQRRVNDAVTSIRLAAGITPFVYFVQGTVGKALGSWIITGWSFITAAAMTVFWLMDVEGQPINLDQFTSLNKVPARLDLIPGSNALNSLNSGFDDGAIPRANIYGTIPIKNAAIRLGQSQIDKDHEFGEAVKKRDGAVSAFKVCKYVGYATIVLGRTGRRCSYARKVLQRVDDRWTRYVNGADANGRPRMVPFDGVVPNEYSRYPSTSGINYDSGPVAGVNHLNVYKTRAGLLQVVEAMRRFGMEILSEPPSSPPPPPPSDCVQKDGLVCPQ